METQLFLVISDTVNYVFALEKINEHIKEGAKTVKVEFINDDNVVVTAEYAQVIEKFEELFGD